VVDHLPEQTVSTPGRPCGRKTGSNAATGNLDIGSNRITLVADGTAKTDVATVNQIQSNGPAFQATDTGTANTYVIALTPAITAYAAGQEITFKAGAASTTASTLNVNTLGAKALKKLHDQDIASGDIETGSIVTAVYDGTNFQVTSQLATEGGTPGGSNTQVQYNSSSAFAGSAHFTFDGTSATVANPLFLPDGSASAPALSNTGDTNTGIAFIAADTVGVVTGGTEQFRFGSNPIPGGNKNLVQNGNFTVAQRGTVTSPASGAYLTDRWKNWQTTGGAVTVTQDTSGVFAAFGTDTAMKIDVTTAESSVASGDRFVVAQPIEAQNLQHLKYGLAGAEAITISFCFQSPKSGTHYVAIYQADANRYIWRPFTVSSADTAEQFSLTFSADTGGTINNDTGIGLFLYFPLMAGTDFEGGSDNTWASGEKYGAATMQNLLDNTSNNIYIGRVQMEVGSVGTDFEFEDIGTTLQKCQRYYQQWNILAAFYTIAQGYNAGTTTSRYILPTRQTMRAAPTLSVSNVADFQTQDGGGSKDTTNMTLNSSLPEVVQINATVATQTVSLPSVLGADNSTSRWLAVSAEL
jgi:hypothetical protein